jgi:hypothetical protein
MPWFLGCVRFKVLMVVLVKRAIFWDVMPYSPVEVYLLFRGTHCLHLQDQRVSQTSSNSSTHFLSSSLLGLVFIPEDWDSAFFQNINKHSITSQNIVLFILSPFDLFFFFPIIIIWDSIITKKQYLISLVTSVLFSKAVSCLNVFKCLFDNIVTLSNVLFIILHGTLLCRPI